MDDEDKGIYLPAGFGKMVKERVEERRGMAVKRRLETDGGDVGSFEKHTKGIGSKLFEKMGYKGGGLGKNEQGIVAPIEAKPRPKFMGMGFNDYTESRNQPRADFTSPLEPKEKQQPAAKEKKEKEWKKKHCQSRAKKEYITVEELLAQQEEQGGRVISLEILDLRGPQAKVLTNLENLHAQQVVKESDVPMPELQYNIRLIVDLTKLDIEKLDRRLKNERETVVALYEEKEKLQEEAFLWKKQLDAMEEITSVLKLTEDECSSGSLTLEILALTFEDLQSRFAEDYKLWNMSSIACCFAEHFFTRLFEGWDPLQNPAHGKDLVYLWKNLLQGGEERVDFSSGTVSPYAQLIMKAVLPAVRIWAVNAWNPRDPEPMLRFFDLWEELLPFSVKQFILDTVLIPKLSAAVASWDPCRESMAIHFWVLPWLHFLHEKMEPICQTIRGKFGTALQAWHPRDVSVFTILNSWKTVFDPASWEQLIVRSILPKLYEVLREFQITPKNQQLEEFNWVKMWASAVPVHHMVNLFEAHFFRKWLEVLYQWLNSNPDFGEVEHWYRTWKSLIPQELLASERIRSHLKMAATMMLQAVEGVQVTEPGSRESFSFFCANEQSQFIQKQAGAGGAFAPQQLSMMGMMGSMDGGETEMSLTEVIAAFAEEHDLLFMPKPGRLYHGSQVYLFGSIRVIVDAVAQNIFALKGEQQTLVTLEQLVQMQNVKQR